LAVKKVCVSAFFLVNNDMMIKRRKYPRIMDKMIEGLSVVMGCRGEIQLQTYYKILNKVDFSLDDANYQNINGQNNYFIRSLSNLKIVVILGLNV
jgi:hypothetical protein